MAFYRATWISLQKYILVIDNRSFTCIWNLGLLKLRKLVNLLKSIDFDDILDLLFQIVKPFLKDFELSLLDDRDEFYFVSFFYEGVSFRNLYFCDVLKEVFDWAIWKVDK